MFLPPPKSDSPIIICQLLDQAFTEDQSLVDRFPKAPASHGQRSETLLTSVQDRLGHDRRYAINADKCRSRMGFTPQESFETGIRKTIDWMLANEPWWRAVMNGSYLNWLDQQYGKGSDSLPSR